MPLINEVQPNPNGGDPATTQVEISGTPGASFTGFLVSIESDNTGTAGEVQQVDAVSGTFDANGLLVVSVPDFENPSFTLVLTDTNPGLGTDIDTNNDGIVDNGGVLGNIEDALGVPDSGSDPVYGSQLGGFDLPYVSSVGEPHHAFRDPNTGDWYQSDGTDVYDSTGSITSLPAGLSFGSVNQCFMQGTLITTERGEVPVELLLESDMVKTKSGQFKSIKWVGIQRVEGPADIKFGNPICIKADTIVKGVPERDLYLSPDHAILIDGLLINSGALVNNHTIFESKPLSAYTYYHIELDQHEIILAEGLETESYLATQSNRSYFDNESSYQGVAQVMSIPLNIPRIVNSMKVPLGIKRKLNGQVEERRPA